MKNYQKLLTFFITILLFTNCEKENFIEEPLEASTPKGTQINYINEAEVPQIINSITSLTGQSSVKINLKGGKSINYKKAIVDLENILKVKNKDNITNYTFGIDVEDAPINEFYNLVVNESPSGKIKKPYVVKYVVDDDALDNFIAHQGDFDYFKGRRYILSFDRFFKDYDTNITKAFDSCDNGIPVNNIGMGNSGDLWDITYENYLQTNPNNYNYTSGGVAGQSYGLYFNSYNTSNFNDTSYGNYVTNDNPIEVSSSDSNWSIEVFGIVGTNYTAIVVTGDNGNVSVFGSNAEGIYTLLYTYTPQHQKSSKITKSEDDCPEDDGEVGIVKYRKGCSFYDTDSVHYVYGGDGYCYPESYFDDQIFIDQAFKDNPCLKSVYDAIGGATKFNEYLQNFEPEGSLADLRFSVDDNFKTNELPKYHNAMAITKPPINSNEIVIKFNTDSNTTGNITNKPDVFKAVSMIHEIIHADMYRKMLDAVRATEISGNNLNWTNWTSEQFYNDFLDSLENKYFGIFYYFTKYKYGVPTAEEPNDYQHQQIAQYYRDVIKQALTDYDPTLSNSQKEALSWIGLNTADIVAWQLLTPEQKVTINNLQTIIKNTLPNGCN